MSISVGQRIEDEYSRIREQNEEIRRKRVAEVHGKIPRVAEIDAQLLELRTGMIRTIMERGADRAEIETRIKTLLEKRDFLLLSAGFPEDYTSAVFTCKKCSDTGFIMTTPCECYKQKKMEILREYANLTESMKSCTFDRFDFSLYEKIPDGGISPYDNAVYAYNYCRNFVDRGGYKEGKNIILYGSTGLGKTFLCSCIAASLTEAGVAVMYQTAYNLTSHMEEQKFRGADNFELTNLYYNVPVLIIDDLGTEFSSSFVSSVIFDLLNYRLGNKKSTVISTNLSLDEIKEQYGPRVQSRILGEYELLKLSGSDIRTKKLLD